MSGAVRALGLTVRVAIAPTAAAAWALARSSPLPSRERGTRAQRARVRGRRVRPRPLTPSLAAPLPQGERGLLEQLAPLHVSALRLEPDTVRTLERLGLKTIGALIDLPRLALARRFRGAEDVVDALDRLVGRKPEPLTAAPVRTAAALGAAARGTRNASRSRRAGARAADSRTRARSFRSGISALGG